MRGNILTREHTVQPMGAEFLAKPYRMEQSIAMRNTNVLVSQPKSLQRPEAEKKQTGAEAFLDLLHQLQRIVSPQRDDLEIQYAKGKRSQQLALPPIASQSEANDSQDSDNASLVPAVANPLLAVPASQATPPPTAVDPVEQPDRVDRDENRQESPAMQACWGAVKEGLLIGTGKPQKEAKKKPSAKAKAAKLAKAGKPCGKKAQVAKKKSVAKHDKVKGSKPAKKIAKQLQAKGKGAKPWSETNPPPKNLIRKYRFGCSRCRHAANCTPSCWARRGF